MGDYTKQTWVDDDGSGTVGTVVTKARMDTIEQGIFDATKQASMNENASFDGSASATNDKKRIVWRRTSDGGYLASHELFETGSGATQVVQQQDRVDATTNTNGAVTRRVIEVRTRGGTPIVTGVARLKVEGTRGGRYKVLAETVAEGGADPTFSGTILDDTGYSDYARPTFQVGGALPATPYDGQEVVYIADSTTGVTWHMKYRLSDLKWYCIGGQPLLVAAPIASNVDITSTTYATFTSTPSFTTTFAGVYRVRFGHSGFATGQITMTVAPSANGAAPTDQTDAVVAGYGVANVDQYGVSRAMNLTVTTAGHAIDLRAKVSAGTGKMRQPWMEVMPAKA